VGVIVDLVFDGDGDGDDDGDEVSGFGPGT
jgi:hypothetical protein